MISFLKGEIIDKNENGVILLVNGVGFEVLVPYTTLIGLPQIYQEASLFTYLQVREDALTLFGFATKEDLECFKLLITVNGIGPKAALGILSYMSVKDLILAIISEDIKKISKSPGIGQKTAQKLVLELKDKFDPEEVLTGGFGTQADFVAAGVNPEASGGKGKRTEVQTTPGKIRPEVQQEAAAALAALGYSPSVALKAVRQVEGDENTTVEDLLKKSLKFM